MSTAKGLVPSKLCLGKIFLAFGNNYNQTRNTMQNNYLKAVTLGWIALAMAACNQTPTAEDKSPDSAGGPASTGDDIIIHDQSNRRLLPGRPDHSALAKSSVGSYVDASGQVEIKIWENSGAGHHNSVSVAVDNDYVLIGGGAWADYGTGSGALLTASFPNNNQLMTWTARSKDHLQSSYHTLRTYAIGMRLKNASGAYIPRSAVAAALTWVKHTGSQTSHPSGSVDLPSGYKLLSGGAEAVYSCDGSLLTASYPSDDNTWSGASKDHGAGCPAKMATYAIGITTGYIPDFGYMSVDVRPSMEVTDTQVRLVGTLSGNPSGGYLLSGIGAKTTFAPSKGRLLFRMSPQENANQYFEVSSKDHAGREDAGTLQISMIQFRKM